MFLVRGSYLHGPEQVHHLDGTLGTLSALVAGLGAGTLDGLLDGVRGEHAEEDGHAGAQRRAGHALGHLAAHIVVVAGAAPDDGTQGDDRVVLAAPRHLGRRQGDLKGTGHPGHADIIRPDAMAQQSILTAAEQLGDDELIEPGRYDAHPDALSDQFSLIDFHSTAPPHS